jgi:2-desacetyl-2-hydroxyethyl bacteriochlorophyllide A dehydrogenase
VPSHQARAFWVVSPGRGELRDSTLPTPSSADVLVRTLFSGVSRGTESLVFTGQVPAAEWQRMRAPFQEGDFPVPVKYGYCNVGIVEQGPAALVGRTVFTLFPHQTRFVVPASAVHLVPEGVPAGRAVLAANMETAVNGVWDAGLQPGDRVVVIGAGTVGCLVAWLAAQIPGCEVTLVDVNAARAAVAPTLGVAFAQPADTPGDADVVVHASGAPDGLALALRVAGFEATVVEMSWYGTREVQLPLGESFHSRRLTIRSSQVGHVAASQRARWDYRRRMQLALALLRPATLDALVSGESAFDELPHVMHALATGSMDALCHRIRY